MIAFVFCLRPDRTPVWLPEKMARSLGVSNGQMISVEIFNGVEVKHLLNSRLAANEAGQHCDIEWHRKNGYE